MTYITYTMYTFSNKYKIGAQTAKHTHTRNHDVLDVKLYRNNALTWWLMVPGSLALAIRQFNASTQQSIGFHTKIMSSLESIRFSVRLSIEFTFAGNALRMAANIALESKRNVSVSTIVRVGFHKHLITHTHCNVVNRKRLKLALLIV